MNTSKTTDKILLIGIGNYSRADDALGWKFADEFSVQSDLFDIEYRYQLQVEDAELIARYPKVIFVDASHNPIANGFSYYVCSPSPSANFTSHSLTPEHVLWLCESLFNYSPTSYIMAIEGIQWELGKELTPKAAENLTKSILFLESHIKTLN